jgi:hypothetical protein
VKFGKHHTYLLAREKWCHPLKVRVKRKNTPHAKKYHFFARNSQLNRFLTTPVISKVFRVSFAAPVTHQDLSRSGLFSLTAENTRMARSAYCGPENLRFHAVFSSKAMVFKPDPYDSRHRQTKIDS